MNGVSYNWHLGLRQSISDAGANPSAIASAVSDYLTAHPVTIDSLAATKVTTDSTHRFTTDTLANKLIGIEAGAASLTTVKADTQVAGAITHSTSSHAPIDAQKNSDITKAEIEAKLTGEISSHSHAGGSGLTLPQTLAKNFVGC